MTMDAETGSERHILEAHLDENRATVVRKATGLTWEQATRRLGRTPTSVAGIVKHLIDVERWWFAFHLDAQADVEFSSSADNPDGDFDLLPGESMESLISQYEATCAISRDIADRYELTDQVRTTRRDGRRPSLRWVYVHMIEELARHNGHLDIYRELLDGTTDRD